MPSTHISLHYHLIFATHGRSPWIDSEWRARFHDYLGGAVRGLGGQPEGIGGVADHVHLLVSLKATHCLSDFMRELKKGSSVWVHDTIGVRDFRWQEGYAALSVSASVKPQVRDYIARQEEHHRTRTFREELVEFLEKSEIEYDPKFVD